MRFVRFIVYSNLWVASAVWAMTRYTEVQLSGPAPTLAWLNAGGTLLLYSFSRYYSKSKEQRAHGAMMQWRANTPWTTFFTMALGGGLTLWQIFSSALSAQTVFAYAVGAVFAALYPVPFLLRKWGGGLRAVPGLKLLLIGAVWAWTTASIPALHQGVPFSAVSFLERFLWTVALTIPFDVRDLYADPKSLGTLPHLVGVRTATLFSFVLFLSSALLQVHLGYLTPMIAAAALGPLALLLLLSGPQRSDLYSSLFVEGYPWLLLAAWTIMT